MSAAELTITPRYGEALLWAEQIHRNQRRKGKPIPYISHLISVSALVWEDGGTEDQAIAALLHDAIEDAGQSHASIAERFGTAVADIVRDCTDTNGTPGGGEKEPWLLRKTRYITSLEHKPEVSLLVTAADKAHNAGDMVLDARRRERTLAAAQNQVHRLAGTQARCVSLGDGGRQSP